MSGLSFPMGGSGGYLSGYGAAFRYRTNRRAVVSRRPHAWELPRVKIPKLAVGEPPCQLSAGSTILGCFVRKIGDRPRLIAQS